MTIPKRVCLRCYGHAISLQDVPHTLVSPRGKVHKLGEQPGVVSKTECGATITPAWTQ